jgi:hypothetical protein
MGKIAAAATVLCSVEENENKGIEQIWLLNTLNINWY